MKKFVKELNMLQLKVYEYLKKEVTNDGSNLINILTEIEEAFEYVPKNIYEAYGKLTYTERTELIYFITRFILRKENFDYKKG